VNEQNTAVWEQRLGDGLNALAESAAPAATVTVADVIAAGRREIHRRRTRAAFTLSAVLVAGAALTFGALALAHGGGASAPPAETSVTAVASPSIGAGADPAAPTIAFGWLPASLNGEYEVSQNATGPNYTNGVNPHTNLPVFDGPGVSGVQVWAPGDVILTASVSGPGSGVAPDLTFTAAGTVDGHQAWWTTGAPGSRKASTSGNLYLLWQYEPDAWASVSYHGNTDDANGAMILKVANNLAIGPVNAYALPFRMTGLPSGMHADAVDIDLPHQQGAQVGAAALRLCVTSPCTGGGLVITQGSTTWDNNSTLTVDDAPQINPFTGDPMPEVSLPSPKSVTVDGHTAKLWTNAGGATLTFTYGDSRVLISAAGAEYTALGGESGFLTFCDSLTWFGPNPAQWTTSVIG
jgi:hypothetical protein